MTRVGKYQGQGISALCKKRFRFSDDSVLTLAAAEALMKVAPGSEAEAYHEAFRKEQIRFAKRYPGRGYGGRFSRRRFGFFPPVSLPALKFPVSCDKITSD